MSRAETRLRNSKRIGAGSENRFSDKSDAKTKRLRGAEIPSTCLLRKRDEEKHVPVKTGMVPGFPLASPLCKRLI
jgi:hypothetical protein